MLKRFLVTPSVLLCIAWVAGVGAAAAQGVPQQLEALDAKITAIQNTLNGLPTRTELQALAAQLSAIQNTLNGVPTNADLQALAGKVAAIQTGVNRILTTGVTSTPRRYYQTVENTFNGSTAPIACAAGFHMANLYEILDTTNLVYDTTLGRTLDDSGQGPLSEDLGWIRTGSIKDVVNTPGLANCNAYTTADAHSFGTVVGLAGNWGDTVVRQVIPWVPGTATCDSTVRVWCVENP